MKVVLRGTAIGQTVGARHETHRRLIDIEQKLTQLERETLTDPEKRAELQQTHIAHAETLETLRTLDYTAYQQHKHTDGDKPGTLLARLVRDSPVPPSITRIRNPQGRIVHTQTEINTAFYDHLRTLYTAPPASAPSQIDDFLNALPFPTLDDTTKKNIEGHISCEEIKIAIKSLNRNKTPGLDGFPIEFYSSFSDTLTPILETMYRTALEVGHLPQSTMEALVTSLPKPGRDTLLLDNYGPLSLLATEYKILSKILANRIQTSSTINSP